MSNSNYCRVLIGAVALGATAACSDNGITAPGTTKDSPPDVIREARGVWIATVANIDWPSRNDLSADAQRSELRDLLDRAVSNGFNIVVFHVRPAGDAVYNSAIEPWAAMLTGTQGINPGYDPLAYAVAEAHARGLELHAWINPFRAGNAKDTLKFASTHQFVVRRDLLRIYGSQVWFDPGDPAVHDHVVQVVRDIVQRYDIDAIHADDYFYPYQEKDALGKTIDFPDSATYARSGTTLTRADWRRGNVDRFVQRLYSEVHQLKPTIKVGLSPFGIWRPGNPIGVTGLDAWATIYADSRRWLNAGWIDYFAPQLYWSIASSGQSFPALLDWWIGQNSMGRHVWPGLAAYRVSDGTSSAFAANEIANQITMTRLRPGSTGHLLYNATATLKRTPTPVSASVAPLYAERALVPASPWLDGTSPSAPTITVDNTTLHITPAAGSTVRWWFVRAHGALGWTSRVHFGTTIDIPFPGAPDRVLVNAVNAAGNASSAADWRR